MTWYSLILFGHILGVLGLYMAFAVELASMIGARRAQTIEAVRLWSSASKPLDMIFPITSLLILFAGLAMTIGVWGWGHAWIDLSLVSLILLSIVGAVINGGYARQIAQRAAELGQGPIPPDFRHELNHPAHWMSVIGTGTMGLGIAFLMVEKPGWLGSVITLIVALMLGVILAQMLMRSDQVLIPTQEITREKKQIAELPSGH
jgi:hypothetical protein